MEKIFALLLLTDYDGDRPIMLATVRGADVDEALKKVGGRNCCGIRIAEHPNKKWTILLPGRSEAILVGVSGKTVEVLEKLHPEGIAHVYIGTLVTSKPASLVQDDRFAFYLCETPEIV